MKNVKENLVAALLSALLLLFVSPQLQAAKLLTPQTCLEIESAFAVDGLPPPVISEPNGARVTINGKDIVVKGPNTLHAAIGADAVVWREVFGSFGRNFYYKLERGKWVEYSAKEYLREQEAFTREFGDMGMNFKKDTIATRDVKVDFKPEPFHGEFLEATAKAAEPLMDVISRTIEGYVSQKAGKGETNLREVFDNLDLPSTMNSGQRERVFKIVEQLVSIFENSPYNRKEFRDPRMKGYPINKGAIGFDMVMQVAKEITEIVIFEWNGGTPSGASNFEAMLHLMKKRDPESFRLVYEHIVKNETFQLFRDSLQQSAEQWTGRKGLVVVVSPGETNGAHPDVASIASLTGMIEVRPGDLVRGNDGYIYIKQADGNLSRDPVIGMYSRKEFTYVVSGGNHQNLEKGEIALDNGQYHPSMLRPDKDGVHPSLLEAIYDKKIWVNNFAGQLADNKTALELFHELANIKHPNAPVIAQPPPSIPPSQWRERFIENNNWENFEWVVKPSGESGGKGIAISPQLSRAEKIEKGVEPIKEEIAKMEADPNYVPQHVMQQVVASTHGNTVVNGEYGQRVSDARFFLFAFPDGTVRIGSTGILNRRAPDNSMIPNTSFEGPTGGGMYGIPVAVGKNKRGPGRMEEVLPTIPGQTIMPESMGRMLMEFGRRSKELSKVRTKKEALEMLKEFSIPMIEYVEVTNNGELRRVSSTDYIQIGRAVFAQTGWNYQKLQVTADRLRAGNITFKQFRQEFREAYKQMEKDALDGGGDFWGRQAAAQLAAGIRAAR